MVPFWKREAKGRKNPGPLRSRPARAYPGAVRAPLEYPGRRPAGSYVFHRGWVHPLDTEHRLHCERPTDLDDFLTRRTGFPLASRYAVLAVGSNACPGRLLEKFGAESDSAIPVLSGRVAGVIAAYAAGVARYGAIPATSWPLAGATARLWVTLLDPITLDRMNESENVGRIYKVIPVDGGFESDEGFSLAPIYTYQSQATLAFDGEPVPVAGFSVSGRELPPPLTQPEVLRRVCDAIGFLPGEDVESRSRALRGSPAQRRSFRRDLKARLTLAAAGFEERPPIPPDVRTVTISSA